MTPSIIMTPALHSSRFGFVLPRNRGYNVSSHPSLYTIRQGAYLCSASVCYHSTGCPGSTLFSSHGRFPLHAYPRVQLPSLPCPPPPPNSSYLQGLQSPSPLEWGRTLFPHSPRMTTNPPRHVSPSTKVWGQKMTISCGSFPPQHLHMPRVRIMFGWRRCQALSGHTAT